MTVQPGDIAPDFEQDTFNGSIKFHRWIGKSWCILFSTIDFADANRLKPEYYRRGVKLVGLSTEVPAPEQGATLEFPVIVDTDQAVRGLYGKMAPGSACLIDPGKRIRLMRSDPADRCDLDGLLRWFDDLRQADASQGRGASQVIGPA